MELDWTTFFLEIINFLILVWIMNRLLYRPVMDAITARQECQIQKAAEAERLQNEAADLEIRYRLRLTEWEKEKQDLRTIMLAELSAERTRLEAALHVSLEQERAKAAAIREREMHDKLREMEQTALAQGGRFVARILKETATLQLEERLLELFFSGLPMLPPEQIRRIADALREPEGVVRVATAYACPETHRIRIHQQLTDLCEYHGNIEFIEEPSLMAGILLRVGPWILDITLRGELTFFTEGAHHDDSPV